ncbi:MAG: YfiR family protein [Verrucomicrobiota bacterium]
MTFKTQTKAMRPGHGLARGHRRGWLAGLAALLAVFVWPGVAASPPSPTEYQIKAAFLYNFAKYIEWPAEKFPQSNSPIVMGVLGKDPFGVNLEKTIQGQHIGGRPLVVKRFEDIEGINGCHLLFVSSSERRRVADILERIKNDHILTVGESERFAAQGGVVNFIMVESKVRFEINVDAARRARLKISSKLLNLAQVVRDDKGTE